MANKVSYIIQLRDKFSAVSQKVNRNFDNIRRNAEKTNRTFRTKLSRGFAHLKTKAVAAAAALGAVATALKGIKVGADFEDAIAELSAITGAKGKDLIDMGKSAMIMARQFGISQSIVAKSLTQVASSKSELLETPGAVAEVTKQSLILSKAAGIEVPDAIRASVGALNQWGVGADQAGRFVNVLAAGAKVGASTIGDTAQALKNAGTVAAQFGLTFEETNALLQVFAKNEIKGAEAGTQLRGVLAKLEQFKEGRFAPSKLGIIKSLEAVKNLGLSNIEIIKEFGIENQKGALILQRNLPLVRSWTRELAGTDEALRQADIRMSTFSEAVKRLGTSLAGLAITVFSILEPILTPIIKAITFFINLIDGLIRSISNLVGTQIFKFIVKGKAPDLSELKSEFLAPFGKDGKGSPIAPTSKNGGTVDMGITVSASPGSKVEKTTTKNNTDNLNIGTNMAGAY